MMRLLLTVVATATVALFGDVTSVLATPITYTETVTGTGTLGLFSFTNALVTLRLLGDTTSVTNPFSGEYEDSGTTTVNVAGILGTAAFTGSTDAYVFQPGIVAGIRDGDRPLTPDLLDTANAAFATYTLQTAIGPVLGTGSFFNSGVLYPTTLGNFTLTSIQGKPTYTAATPVPEPASLMLLGTGVVTLFSSRFRRRRSMSRSSQ